jgi:surface polysaccharide O-acyltransferase-like enzyme
MFIMIFCALCSQQIIPEAVAPLSNRKARRLLLPWLFWSTVFLGVTFIKVAIRGYGFSTTFKWNMLIYGSSTHLWFLPYAFAAALIVNMLQRWASRGIFGRVQDKKSTVVPSISMPHTRRQNS